MMFLPSICGGAQLNRLLSCVDQVLALEGEIWECGVYQGGSASRILQRLIDGGVTKQLRLFDTFGSGMPVVGAHDTIPKGHFAISSDQYNAIKTHFALHPNVKLHPGIIPDTFAGLESSRIALAHIDVDVFDTYNACLDFVWPRLTNGGFLVFDDYAVAEVGGPCPGARLAVDAFVSKNKLNLVLTPAWGATVQKV